MRAAIEARDVFRVYSTPQGDAAALQGLSVTVHEREVLTVLGPSGAGKTTFLRILAGLDRPSAGTVRVFGREIGKLGGRMLAAYRANTLGYADQHYARALAAELTARDLVSVPLRLRGVPRGRAEARADELLERVGLAEQRNARPPELAGGEQQRVAVCAALAHRPPLFLADEPTGELDSLSAAEVYRLIGDLAREQGSTAVIVSHDPASSAIADRTIQIRDGRVSEESARAASGEELIVVGRGGWLRVSEELLRRVGIGSHAAARLEGREIVLSSAGDGRGPEQPDPAPPAAIPARRDDHADGQVASVAGLVKRYGEGETASIPIDGLSASFEAGRLYAVTGPSGSGKTTFLHVLAGLERPTAGDVVVLGSPLGPLDRGARARLRRRAIALVGQQAGLVPFLTARENVELGLELREIDLTDRDLAVSALAAVGLAERTDQYVGRLSAGERVRVAVARALAARPSLLLADEPTARLDQGNALAIAALLARLAHESGATVICATHDPLVIEQADHELPLGRRRSQTESSSGTRSSSRS
jgi:ABC-type lipoprotein export system ATPase subunit